MSIFYEQANMMQFYLQIILQRESNYSMNGITIQIDKLIQQINQTLIKPITQLNQDIFDLNYYSFTHKVFNMSSIILQYAEVSKQARICFQKLVKKMKQAAKCRPQQESEDSDQKQSKDQITTFLNTRKPIVQSKDRGQLYRFLTVRQQRQKDNRNFLENLNKIKSGVLKNEKKEQKKNLSEMSVQTGICWVRRLQTLQESNHYINMLQIRQQILGKSQVNWKVQENETEEQMSGRQKIKTSKTKKLIQKSEKKIETSKRINEVIKKSQKTPQTQQQQEKIALRSDNGSIGKNKNNIKKHKAIKQKQKKETLLPANDKSAKRFNNNSQEKNPTSANQMDDGQNLNIETNKNTEVKKEQRYDDQAGEDTIMNEQDSNCVREKSCNSQKIKKNINKNDEIEKQQTSMSGKIKINEKNFTIQNKVRQQIEVNNANFNDDNSKNSQRLNNSCENDCTPITNIDSINNSEIKKKRDQYSQHIYNKNKLNKGIGQYQTIQQQEIQMDVNKSLNIEHNKQNIHQSLQPMEKIRSNSNNNNIFNERVLKKNSNASNLSSHSHLSQLHAQKQDNKSHLPSIKDNWDKKGIRKTKQKIIEKNTRSLWNNMSNVQNELSYMQENENADFNMDLSDIKQRMKTLLNKNKIDKKQLIQNDKSIIEVLQKIKYSNHNNLRNVFYATNTKDMNDPISIHSKHEHKIKECVRLMETIHQKACGRPGCRHLQRFYEFVKVFRFQGRKQFKLPTYNVGSINIQNYK